MENNDSNITIEGVLDKIIYVNDENDYTVGILINSDTKEEITIVGNMIGINPGESLKIEGKWETNPRYGKQIKVFSYQPILPKNLEAIEKYLSSGMIKGIGTEYAKRIVSRFGENTLDVLDNEPERLSDVSGIGEKRQETIIKAWAEQKHIRELMIFLHSHNISATFASKIFKKYGNTAISIIRDNPYILSYDIQGIGFKTADKMAMSLGIEPDSINRVEAGILYILVGLTEEGHCYYPYEPLIAKCVEMMSVDEGLVSEGIMHLKKRRQIEVEEMPSNEVAVYPKSLYISEKSAAERFVDIVKSKKELPEINIEKAISWFEIKHKMKLSNNQKSALEKVLKGIPIVITGGPGTGKTTLIRAIVEIFEAKGVKVLISAPTGRAAKKIEEMTSRPASTIHRMLKYNKYNGKFIFNIDNPLDCDVLIVDEISMLDIVLANHLFKAVKPSANIVLIGDVDQLPSVGPGNFLKDVIDSKIIDVIRLNVIFRQSQQSKIIANAHCVNKGEMPNLKSKERIYAFPTKEDFYFISREEPDELLDTIIFLVSERIPQRFGYNPLEDIQVITPVNKGVLGSTNLNVHLQRVLNKETLTIIKGSKMFKIGDRIMQSVNNYDKNVFNGDIGRIIEINYEEHNVIVKYDEQTVFYDFEELDELMLSYAITVHKSQGCEFKAVVMPVHTQHFRMLQRNLLYTGITRAKELMCLVGNAKAVQIAVKNNYVSKRYTGLVHRLVI